MSETKPSADTSSQSTTRVDAAHLPIAEEVPHSVEPSMDLLSAIAGQNPQQAAEQSREQATELAMLLQEKQRFLDQRESELNARSALLENDLRNSRLRPAHHVNEQDEEASTNTSEIEPSPMEYGIDLAQALTEEESLGKPSPLTRGATNQPAEPAKTDESQSNPTRWRFDDRDDNNQRTQPILSMEEDSEEIEIAATVPLQSSNHSTESSVATPPPTPTGETVEDLPEQQRELNEQRDALIRRKVQLDSRSAHVEQLYEQVTHLHREALELQLSTESLWTELNADHPGAEDLSKQLSETRARLADHYRLTNETLAERKDELHSLREELNSQETRLRQQRRELQMWADRRYDEIETRTAHLIRREREIDRMEADFARQSIQWQQQREDYRQEIERLSWELRSDSAVATS
ncbi:MAG: hypothetical protein GY768_01300 [Planctomycetaceae bacterium]|nr:hypothetical protein [Planctomycetaceae bacterium]